MNLAKTETFEHTISGLLKKRSQLFTEAELIRDRLAELKNDIGAIDRILGLLGADGDFDAMMPNQKRTIVFGPGELAKAIMAELRRATAPLSSRDIACGIAAQRGEDSRDKKYIYVLIKGVGKSLRALRDNEGLVRSIGTGRGKMKWERRVSY